MAYYRNPYLRPLALCGCWYILPNDSLQKYLPLVDLESSTTILSTTSRTKLVQQFSNNRDSPIREAKYTFPLYDGVSVVSFKCTVGERTIVGVVKEKQQARADYEKAVSHGQTAGLLEQLSDASDVFTTKIGNIPAGGIVSVEIVYIGELKHDTESDGIRFTIPTAIAPRYGSASEDTVKAMSSARSAVAKDGIKIMVDIGVEEGSAIRGVQSPSHPIAVTLGRNAAHDESVFQNHLASATLSLSGKTELDKDFIIVVKAPNQDTPRALLEAHESIPNQRALMTTLVPKFNLPNSSPEIVFVIDRSGSMGGKIPLVVQALKIFLKSLPTSAKFNICSFGSNFTFLFPKSRAYDQSSLKEALSHADTFDANYGGTEMLQPIKKCCEQRLSKTTPLEIMVLTDGEIWNQDALFQYINDSAKEKVRVFSLGIGSGASSSLVEGMARAGNGFSQFVHDGEQIDKRVVRMLKGALTPFVSDYSLEVVYEADPNTKKSPSEKDDDDFEMIESFAESVKTLVDSAETKSKSPISLFSKTFKEEAPSNKSAGRYDHLPTIAVPKVLQAPYQVPQLYSFSRTTIHLLLGPDSCQGRPKKVILRGTSEHGPLELEIPVQDVGSGQTLHQLAAKKATQDLEEGRGWIIEATTDKGKALKSKYEGDWERIVEREAVRLGIQFQVAGKYCSFVAVETDSDGKEKVTPIETEDDDESEDSSTGSKMPWLSKFTNKKKKRTVHQGFASTAVMYRSRASVAPAANFGSAVPPPPPPSAPLSGSFAASAPMPAQQASYHPPPGGPPPPAARGGAGLFGGSGGDGALNSFAPRKATESARFKLATYSSQPRARRESSELRKKAAATSLKEKEESDEEMGFALYDDEAVPSRLSPVADTQAVDSSRFGGRSKAPESIMHAIIELQEFDGGWQQVDKLLSSTGISRDKFQNGLASVQSTSVKATALALAWLQTKAASDKDTWEMVADKARDWLAGQDGVDDVQKLIDEAKAAFL